MNPTIYVMLVDGEYDRASASLKRLVEHANTVSSKEIVSSVLVRRTIKENVEKGGKPQANIDVKDDEGNVSNTLTFIRDTLYWKA